MWSGKGDGRGQHSGKRASTNSGACNGGTWGTSRVEDRRRVLLWKRIRWRSVHRCLFFKHVHSTLTTARCTDTTSSMPLYALRPSLRLSLLVPFDTGAILKLVDNLARTVLAAPLCASSRVVPRLGKPGVIHCSPVSPYLSSAHHFTPWSLERSCARTTTLRCPLCVMWLGYLVISTTDFSYIDHSYSMHGFIDHGYFLPFTLATSITTQKAIICVEHSPRIFL
uniref:Uncharacterized protein n=1 Tax=Oryza glaberrima TaxID=4538 RepID=I1QWW3_ORYGL